MKKDIECEQIKWKFEKPITVGKTELLWIIPYVIVLFLSYVFFN